MMWMWNSSVINIMDSSITAQDLDVTADNATGGEALGTTTVIPFVVSAYKSNGQTGSIWTTEVTVEQTGTPVETAAA